MVFEAIKITRQRGGNQHPLSTRDFVIAYLSMRGEATVSEVHGAYKWKLKELAAANGRRRPYQWARYSNFKTKMLRLIGEGVIEYTGKDQEPTSALFQYWPEKPKMRVYRLTAGGMLGTASMNGHQDGHKPAMMHDAGEISENGHQDGHSTDGAGEKE